MTTHAPIHVKPKTTEEFALDHHSVLTTIILASLLTVSLAAFLFIFCKKEKLCCFNPGRRSRFTLIDLISSPVDPPRKPSASSLIFNFTKKFSEKEPEVKNRGSFTFDVIDRSTSRSCQFGLMEELDTVVLDFNVDLTDTTITDDTKINIKALDTTNNQAIMICEFRVMSECTNIMYMNCSCQNYANQRYTIRYSSLANIGLDRKLILVNDQSNSRAMPYIFKRKPVISHSVSNTNNVTVLRYCVIQVPQVIPVDLMMCVSGLNYPILYISYHTFNWTFSGDCANIIVQEIAADEAIFLRYTDKCNRNSVIKCQLERARVTLRPVPPGGQNSKTQKSVTRTPVNTPAPHLDETSSTVTWRIVLYILVVVLVSGFVALVIKIRRNNSSLTPDQLSMNTVNSGHTPAPNKSKASISSLRELVQRLSNRSFSSRTNIIKTIPASSPDWTGTEV